MERNGQEARSARTRTQLIEAAVEVIGTVGYEGATTRELTKTAKTNLSAIPYHFGGKRELYLAAAEMVADYAWGRFEEVIDILGNGDAAALEDGLKYFLHIMLEDAEPHSWTSFVARCAFDNDEAFALIHARAIAPVSNRLTEMVADLSSGSVDEDAVRLRVNAIVTAIIGFRLLRGIMQRGMSCDDLPKSYADQLRLMIADLCRSDFLGIADRQ